MMILKCIRKKENAMIAAFKKNSSRLLILAFAVCVIMGLVVLASAKEQRNLSNQSSHAVELSFIKDVDVMRRDLIKAEEKKYVESSTFNPQNCYRGVAFLASNIGKDISSNEILEFVRTCRLDLVVIDFAWIIIVVFLYNS